MSDGLPTARSLSRIGLGVLVWCKACQRQGFADLAAVVETGRGDVPLVRLRWRCSGCHTSRHTDFVVSSRDAARARPW
jgi:hypothetical protein